jgi:hypothetical protein
MATIKIRPCVKISNAADQKIIGRWLEPLKLGGVQATQPAACFAGLLKFPQPNLMLGRHMPADTQPQDAGQGSAQSPTSAKRKGERHE